jgi:hypothetical protein
MKLVASITPYSSVVGTSVVLRKPKGPVVAQYSVLLAGSKARQIALATLLADAINSSPLFEKVRLPEVEDA